MSLLPRAEAILAAQSVETGGRLVEEDDRPSRRELGEWVGDFLTPDNDPTIVSLSQVKTGVQRPATPRDRGRDRPLGRLPREAGEGADDLEWGAKNTLWGSHAGPSKCAVTKREGVSEFYVGFEINCPGWLYPTPDPNLYIPWFNSVTTPKGVIVPNSNKQATVTNPAGVIYRPGELRFAKAQTGNIAPGAYVPYTDAQQIALVNVMLSLKRTFPRTFRLDYVFGHDEVSPGRKVDPGASLGALTGTVPGTPMTMQQLRSHLLKTWADQQLYGVRGN